jgi:hypothetical protein
VVTGLCSSIGTAATKGNYYFLTIISDMTTTLRSLAIVSLAIAFAMGAVFVAYAETSTATDAERITKLEGLVEDLQDDLDAANDRIEALEKKLSTFRASSTSWKLDDSRNKGKREKIEGDGTGPVKVCHMEVNDIRVGFPALKAHLAHGDELGECGSEHRYRQHSDDDDDADEDDDDDDSEDEDDN